MYELNAVSHPSLFIEYFTRNAFFFKYNSHNLFINNQFDNDFNVMCKCSFESIIIAFHVSIFHLYLIN